MFTPNFSLESDREREREMVCLHSSYPNVICWIECNLINVLMTNLLRFFSVFFSLSFGSLRIWVGLARYWMLNLSSALDLDVFCEFFYCSCRCCCCWWCCCYFVSLMKLIQFLFSPFFHSYYALVVFYPILIYKQMCLFSYFVSYICHLTTTATLNALKQLMSDAVPLYRKTKLSASYE